MPRPMDRAYRTTWSAPIDDNFRGKAVMCIGGGPSIMGAKDKDGNVLYPPFDFEPYRHIPKIAVNQAAELVPEAKYLLFADHRWYTWNEVLVRSWKGERITVGVSHYPDEVPVKRMIRCKDAGLCTQPNELAGIDSGCLAVNLAYHLGASRIILIGYDSGFGPRLEPDGSVTKMATHYHDKHQTPPNNAFYTDRYGPRLSGLCQRLRDVGVPVVRSTPPGRPDIPYMALPDALTAPLPPCEGLITEFVP